MEDHAPEEVIANLKPGFSKDHELAVFHAGTIGPEPSGATPIEDEDLAGLIPTFIATRSDLNTVEFDNIAKALPWAFQRAREMGPQGILEFNFLLDLHRAMFEDVWKWAGTLRRRETNIGIDPNLIVSQTRLALDDARFWITNDIYVPIEVATRIHCRLVTIHPFSNGNGRTTRLMADLYLVSIDQEPLPWGNSSLEVDGQVRETYIAALVKATTQNDYTDLIDFARGAVE